MNNLCKILIADGLAKEGISQLKSNPRIELMEFAALERDELKNKINDIDILIVRSRTQVDRDLLSESSRLKIVIRAGIGLDNIDVPAATERGIVVMNAPTGNIVTTAEHSLALLFAVSRNVPQADAALKMGKWEKKKFQGHEIRGKTLGLVGLGNIGKAVAERAIGLGMKVISHDPYLSPEAALKYKVGLVSLDELLRQSDYVSIHTPLTDNTKNLISDDAFGKMKKGAYVINCARGGIINEAALIKALDNGKIAGAALDVFETEPLPSDHPLLKRGDVVLTPHLGASTDEAQVQVGKEVAIEVEQYLEQGAFRNAINVPNITLEQMEVLRPYLNLCEKIGSFAGQIAERQSIKKIKLSFEGTVSEYQRDVLTLSVLKGFLTPLLSTTVNFVNTKNILRERGIRVEESFDSECDDYASLVKLVVEADSEKLAVSGTLFGKSEARIVSIDNYKIDAILSGCLLYTRNIDQPGVIGSLGSLLGAHGINIARMHLGRTQSNKEAIALITVDSKLQEEPLSELKKIKGMLHVKQVKI